MSETRVLVVEDESIVAMDIADGLRRLGYHVTDIVGTGEHAIESGRRPGPELGLLAVKFKGAV
ncbi:MAG: hypothetical protein ACTHQM_18920, partial [Thermoanaerobaculia bacterium]